MRQLLWAGLALLPSCTSQGVHPLTLQDLATAPYQSATTTEWTGSLLYEGGCLLFRDDAATIQLLPVWPDGSVFNGTTLTFHQPGKADQLLVIAQEFHMEGRPIERSALTDPIDARIQQQCRADPFFVSRVQPAN